MTRSVEIPDEAVAKGAERLWLFRTPIAKTRESCTEQAREVITAALPYLAPALESEVVSWHRKEGYEAGLSARPAEATHTYGNGTHYPPTGGTHVTERCGPKCPPAPAGDGGLREALEKLVEKWEAMDTPGLAAPSNQQWAEGVDCGYSQAADDVRVELAAAPAVPQPVDREALARAIERAAVDVDLAKYFLPGATDRFVEAVLAVLAGEQEQVETDGR